MRRLLFSNLICFILLFSNTLYADAPPDSEYLDGANSKVGLILCHGKGKHPSWKVVDPLRHAVHDKLGYHTLSLQMPNEDKSWKDYADDFEQAYAIINSAIQFLKNEKNVERIYLMGHSMGSRMASAFIANTANHNISGLIIAGCRNNGGIPLACDENMSIVDIPVLDIWGGANGKDVKSANQRRNLVTPQYTQLAIPDANHKFEGYEDEFVAAVMLWLTNQ